jgi:hypothetical protein
MRVCPHTALYMWPHNTIYVAAYHYILQLYMWVLTLQGSFDSYCAINVASTIYVASYYYIILLYMWVRILRGSFDSCSRTLASPVCVSECMSVYSCVYICVSVSVSVPAPVPLCLCLCQWCVCAFVSVSVSVSVVCLCLCQGCVCAFVWCLHVFVMPVYASVFHVIGRDSFGAKPCPHHCLNPSNDLGREVAIPALLAHSCNCVAT